MLRVISLVIVLAFFGCKHTTNPNVPENAINPEVIENPASATQEGTNAKKVPAFKFDQEVHDFGNLVAGEKVSYAFRFKNTGTGELIIRSANGSCGCTVPEFPKDPIPPGGDGIINVTFSSEGKEGQQLKTVTLISNTIPNTYIISIKANVQKK